MSKTSKTSFVQKYANANNLKREVAKHDLVISVNRTDCKRGEKKNPENCAIARRKRLPGVKPQERKLRHADAYRVGVKMEKE